MAELEPAMAGGGRDSQKMGLDYREAPARVWVTLLKATPGLELVSKQAALMRRRTQEEPEFQGSSARAEGCRRQGEVLLSLRYSFLAASGDTRPPRTNTCFLLSCLC